MTSVAKNIEGIADKMSRKMKSFTEGIFNSTMDKHLPVISEKVTIKVLNKRFNVHLRIMCNTCFTIGSYGEFETKNLHWIPFSFFFPNFSHSSLKIYPTNFERVPKKISTPANAST